MSKLRLPRNFSVGLAQAAELYLAISPIVVFTFEGGGTSLRLGAVDQRRHDGARAVEVSFSRFRGSDCGPRTGARVWVWPWGELWGAGLK